MAGDKRHPDSPPIADQALGESDLSAVGEVALPTARDRVLLRRLLEGHGAQLGGIGFASVASAFIEGAFLLLLTRMALAIAAGDSMVELPGGIRWSTGACIALAALAVLVRTLLALLVASSTARISGEAAQALRHRLATVYLNSSWSTKQAERPGRLQELVGTFVKTSLDIVGAASVVLGAGLSLGVLLVIAIVLDPLASVVMVFALGVLALILAPLRRRVRTSSGNSSSSGVDFTTAVSEMASLGMEMHVFGVADGVSERLDTLSRENVGWLRRSISLQIAIPQVYTSLAYLALVGALAVTAVASTDRIPTLSASMLVMLRSLTYGQRLQTSVATLDSSMPFLRTLYDTIAHYEATSDTGGDVWVDSISSVSVRDVSFAYASGEPAVLQSVSFDIGDGEIIGVVGPSGAGKSTLLQLLLGLRRPSSGTISVGDIDLATADPQCLARQMAFVPQQPTLFSGTILENIIFFREGITEADVRRAVRRANLEEDLRSMPAGLDTPVGERGSNLSGGQQQRVAIARALADNPRLLILDEPTSSLDPRSEILIRDALEALRGAATVVIVAHRMTTLTICDRIAVIQNGRLVALDRPEIVSAQEGFFREALDLSR